VTSSTGQFVFEDLTYGSYYLRFEPNCPLIPCYPAQLVFVDGSGDVTVDECYVACPKPLLSPQAGLPGSVVDVAGRCDAARAGQRVELWFDDQPVGTAMGDAAGVYGASVEIPPEARAGTEHAIRAVVDGTEVASEIFAVTVGGALCVGDCNRNYAVTVDEVIRGTRIALHLDEASACQAMDSSGNGAVTIEELIAAVARVLAGCQAPDLVPVTAHFSRCVERTCSAVEEPTHFMQVCVANQGDADAGAFNVFQQENPRSSARIEGIAAGQQACVELPFATNVSIFADTSDEVAERDETNNRLEVPLPFPTACDVVPPPCTPTPTPRSTPTATPT
jgi:hypothetical protein